MNILKILTPKRIVGNVGERAARRYLRRHGYKILETNLVSGDNEVDIIARRKNVIAYVEFKTRNVEIYAGSFVRDIDERAEITAVTITELATLYDKAREAGDTATCIRIAEVYNALGQNDSFDDSMINNSEAVYNYSYAQAFVVATGAIDAADTYANRREAVANIDRYKSFVPEDNELFDSEGKYIQTDGIDETLAKELQKARVALEKERATLDAIRQNSVVFIEILLGQTVETPEEGDPIQIPAYNYAWVDFDREILPYYERLNLLFDDESKNTDFYKGMEMIFNQTKDAFTKLGVSPIDAVGQEFNPDFHNAVMHIDDEAYGENTVVEEFQKGYIYHDKVIRYSMVKVAN